jgi:hypothetical protein
LLNRVEFIGRIVALDLSHGMLEQAALKLRGLDTSEKSAHSTRPAVSTGSAAAKEIFVGESALLALRPGSKTRQKWYDLNRQRQGNQNVPGDWMGAILAF